MTTLKGRRATLADVEQELGPQRTWGAAAARVAARNTTPSDVLVYHSPKEPYHPEAVVRLANGLARHFPGARVSIDTTGGQLRVFAKESDKRRIELMRAFCAGFAASL